MRNRFDAEMQRLRVMMIEMGALCESAIACAIKALLEGDMPCVKRAIELELDINRKEREIEEACYTLLLRQQPVARDLRQISATLKMITDMERVGDQAADIAELAALGNAAQAEAGRHVIRQMSVTAISMVTDSIDAYVKNDLELANKVIKTDDAVDELFDTAKQELTIMLISEAGKAECVIDLLMVAKYLERIADHAVNIAEWVIFIITGEYWDEEKQGDGNGSSLSG